MGTGQPLLERVGNLRLGWFTLLEWIPSAVLVPLAYVEVFAADSAKVSGPAAVVAACAAGAAGALVFRRRHPLAVMITVVVAWAVPLLMWGPQQLSVFVFSTAVAIFSCGAFAPRPSAYAAFPLGFGLLVLTSQVDPAETAGSSGLWSLNVVWIFGLGAWIRQRTALVEQARAESAARAAAAAADDRVRIARDLHDVLAHNLAVMIVQAEAADELMDSDPHRAHRALGHVQDTGRAALADIRGLLGALRGQGDGPVPVPHPAPGLDEVASLVDVMRTSGLPVQLQLSGDFSEVPDAAGQAAYRIVQEALTNTLRHAGPVRTEVSVAIAEHELRVRIHDAGAPTTSSSPAVAMPAVTPGHGLRGMRERIQGEGGSLAAAPDPAGGFTVLAALPVRVSAR